MKPLAQTGKFKVWVVLGGSRLHPSDLIRGLADEDIKKKVLAMPEAVLPEPKPVLADLTQSSKWSAFKSVFALWWTNGRPK